MKIRLAIAIAALLFAGAAPSSAAPIEKGTNILAIQVTHGTADLVAPDFSGDGYITAIAHSEIGIQAQFQHLMSEDWALALSGGIGFFKETDEPGVLASPGDVDFEYSQDSFQARIGVDRFVHISETFHLFTGPGLQVWRGDSDFKGGPSNAFDDESEKVTRISLSGRLGAHIKLGEHFGLIGQFGHVIGHASAKDSDNAKATWWPSSTDGAGGFAFHF
jgi:hypothetical protein